jgi:hypothetical protein
MVSGNLAALASLPDEQLLAMWISSETTKKLGLPLPPLPTEMQTAVDKGKAAFDAGKRADAASLNAIIQGLQATGKSRDEIITALAAVLGMEKAALEAMLGGGGSSAPKGPTSVGG